MRAQVGARSADMKRWPLPGRMLGAKIISIGTNDAAQPLLAANLKAIRVRLNTRRAIWLYPTQEVRPVSCALWPRPSATRYPILAATARKTVPIRKATVTSREHGFASKQSSAPTATANSSIGLALVADHDSSLSALQVCSAGTGNPDKSDVLGGASAGAPVHMSRSLAAKSAGACLLSCYQPRLPRVARGHRA